MEVADVARAREQMRLAPVDGQLHLLVLSPQGAEHQLRLSDGEEVQLAVDEQHRRGDPVGGMDGAGAHIGGGLRPRRAADGALRLFAPAGVASRRDPEGLV